MAGRVRRKMSATPGRGNPAMSVLREVHADGWCVRLDLQSQVLHIEVPELIDGRPGGEPLLPTLPLDDGPVSAATLLWKAKLFDDGLYAGVELAAQQGAGHFVGKATLLRSLAKTLAEELPGSSSAAAVAIHAACELGGLE